MPQVDITDEYFNRVAVCVTRNPELNQLVRYNVFSREEGIVAGVDRAIKYVNEQCVDHLKIWSMRDGDWAESLQPVMVIEGMINELVNLETTFLGMLSYGGVAENMRKVVEAADGKPVIDMSPRHFPFEVIQQVAYAAAIGGAAGTSSRKGIEFVNRYLGENPEYGSLGEMVVTYIPKFPDFEETDPYKPFKLYGSIPHAFNALVNDKEFPSVEAAKIYHKEFPDIPLTVLIDYEGRELDVCREAYNVFGDKLFAVRLDTCGERVHQGGHEWKKREYHDNMKCCAHCVNHPEEPCFETWKKACDNAGNKNEDNGLSRYCSEGAKASLDKFCGKGVTIQEVFNVRNTLDEIGAKDTKIVVSSGFNPEKTKAFVDAGAPFDAIGTGSFVKFRQYTADIYEIYRNDKWVKASKEGRIFKGHDLPLLIDRGNK